MSAISLLLVGLAVGLPVRTATIKPRANDVAAATPQTLAQGALNTILGDLQQEIVDGSTSLTTGAGTTLYLAKAPVSGVVSTAVPAFQIKTGGFTPTFSGGVESDGLGNLLKRSAYGLPFYSGSNYANTGVSRAANVSTTTPSQNGAFSTLARWNKPLLMPATSATDATPASSVSFTAPDWVLVASDGTNPTAVNPNVIGRYAYTIYNEGGLLDVTAAGYATGTSAQQIGYKDSLACADLTQTGLTQPQVDSLLAWRGSHVFSGRQDLLNLLPSIAGASGSLAGVQNAAQYLGTFSRALDQPSIWPNPNRPKVKLKPSTAVGTTYVADSTLPGGNTAYSSDGSLTDVYNPVFRNIQVAASFIRNDGSTAVVGEPLVKKRFALSRVAWITYEGPSATAPDEATLVNEYAKRGMSPNAAKQLLDEGTAANILRSFGLASTPGPGTNGVGGYWTYNHGITNGGATLVGSLYDPNSTSTARDVVSTGREPDFFELLKAGVNVGSVGKDWSGIGTNGYQGVQDSSVAPQIFAIGANIIDEASVTQFPTTIRYYFASGDFRTVYGKTDLPYYNGDTTFTYVAQAPTTLPTSTGAPTATTAPISSSAIGNGYYPTAVGTGVLMMAPSIWNPYDVNSAQVTTGLAPAQLRIVLGDPIQYYNATTGWPSQPSWVMNGSNAWGYGVQSTFDTTQEPTNWQPPSGDTYTPYSVNTASSPPTINYPTIYWAQHAYAQWLSEESTALMFNNVNPANSASRSLYHEPTLLIRATSSANNSPDNYMGLRLGSKHHLLTTNPAWTSGIPEVSGQAYFGELLGTFPLRWTAAANKGGNPPDPNSYYVYTNDLVELLPPSQAATWRLEYLPPGLVDSPGNWIPYQEKMVNGSSTDLLSVPAKPQNGTGTAPFLLTPNDATASNGSGSSLFYGNSILAAYRANAATTATESAWDPRADRWSAPSDMYPTPKFLNGIYSVSNTGTLVAGSMSPTTSPPPTLMMETVRPNGTAGAGTHSSGIPGWHRDGTYPSGNGPFPGIIPQNLYTTPSGGTGFYCYDADYVTRRGSGGNNSTDAPTATTVGLPLATATSNYNSGTLSTDSTTNVSNRPLMLHRPYRTVAELGYVFSDTPWKNLDFSNPESGDTALLDLFCINEDTTPNALASGKVDLNTRQPAVLQALLNGAYRDETGAVAALSSTEAATLAQTLVTRTTSKYIQKGAFPNVGDLVGRFVANYGVYNGTATGNFSTAGQNYQCFDGYGSDLSAYTGGTTSANNLVQRFRESAVRALSGSGMAGTWNLLIDVVAQAGQYPANTTSLGAFVVTGEQRYWLHVAIDRSTGAVLDQSLEPVVETSLGITNATVAENQLSGTVVGTLGAAGPNSASVFTYALVSGAGGDGNPAFNIAGNQLQTAAALQYLAQSSYNVLVSATDQFGASVQQSLTIAVMPSPSTQWKITNFGAQANNPSVSGDLADPDHDGMSNLLEYALGTSPMTANPSGSATTLQQQGNTLTYSYTRLSAATDVTAHVYWNGDLTNPNAWTTQGVTETMLSDDGTIQHWQATLSAGSGQQMFLRLQVTRP